MTWLFFIYWQQQPYIKRKFCITLCVIHFIWLQSIVNTVSSVSFVDRAKNENIPFSRKMYGMIGMMIKKCNRRVYSLWVVEARKRVSVKVFRVNTDFLRFLSVINVVCQSVLIHVTFDCLCLYTLKKHSSIHIPIPTIRYKHRHILFICVLKQKRENKLFI